jgi:hypothetical protein
MSVVSMPKKVYVMVWRDGDRDTWKPVTARFNDLKVAKQFALAELRGRSVEVHQVTLDADGVVTKDFGIAYAKEPDATVVW